MFERSAEALECGIDHLPSLAIARGGVERADLVASVLSAWARGEPRDVIAEGFGIIRALDAVPFYLRDAFEGFARVRRIGMLAAELFERRDIARACEIGPGFLVGWNRWRRRRYWRGLWGRR